MLYYNHSSQATLDDLDSSLRGLSASEAEERLKVHGPNTIRVSGEPLWRKLIEPFANIFMLVLLTAAVISIVHGDTLDAIIVVVIMLVSASIYYIQRFSTERILRSLQKHTTQAVETLRDGRIIQIDMTQLVPGDIISLGEGDKIPADLRFLTGTNVRIDESLLTGESVPISKQPEALTGEKEIYERSNLLFQGSFVIAGDVTAVVTQTGNTTEFGQLAALAQDTNTESPVQMKIDKLVSQVIAVVGAIAVVAFALAVRGGMDIGDSLRFVMALSVSAVPESLPVAISVVLVLGMRRMATKKALVRTMRAIETIGVLTTIATDKTGTLTKNKLTVQEVWHPEGSDASLHRIMAHAINQNGRKIHDPLDTAMTEYTSHAGIELRGAPLLSLPFDQAIAMSGNLWHDGAAYRLIVKGAPEHVLARSDLTEGEHEQASTRLHHLTSQGYRVIAIAEAKLTTKLSSFAQLSKRSKLDFVGFVAVADVLRPEAKKAVAAAQAAGVTVRMITGDHFETAYHIGRQLGMVTHRDQVFDSRRMDVMSDSELDEIIHDIRVFSRVIPEHKYRILALLKKHNITAMTGDGVNDVPALSNAHVGVAMGSGSQIAKDAGDIILLDDNFRSIIDAMHEGRTIFANIRRMLFYLLSTNAGEVLTMLGALAIGLPLPIVPVQILWINLVTDTSMVIPLGLEPGEKSNMKNRPKRLSEPILSKFIISRVALVALSMAIVALSLYAIFNSLYGHEYGRTIAFSALVVMQWSNAFNARSDYESLFRRLRIFNGKFYVGLTIAITLQALAVFGPLQGLLHVHPVAIGDLVITGVIAFIIPLLLSELHKFIGRRFFHKAQPR